MENRWWENYAVRYFVGTVVGSVAIALLNSQAGSPFLGRFSLLVDTKETPYLGFGLAAALGLAFCYLASAPVLTMHGMRAHLRISAARSAPIKTALCLLLPAVGVVIALSCVLPVLTASIAGVVIGLQFGLLILALITLGGTIESFYRSLAEHRALANTEKDKPQNANSEYVTSYRHLREHGNAFSIVILEGLLAVVLFQSPSLQVAALILLAWSVPAALSWLLGTLLESRFVTKAVH